jgi:hyperosmotically inducible protein
MYKTKTVVFMSMLATAMLFGGLAQAQTESAGKADNTAVNEAIVDTKGQTADQQSQAWSDRELTKTIRRAVVTDGTLSYYAHNVKIITKRGVVTLKGPVRSEEERMVLIKKASDIAGADKVIDEIEVAPKK